MKSSQTAKMDPNSKLADPIKRKLKSISETIDQQRDLFFKCTDPDKRDGIRSVLNALKHQFNQIYSQLYGTPYFALATVEPPNIEINAIARLKEFAAEIKPANRGKLHERLGIPEDEKIPMPRLQSEKKKAKDSGDTELEKMVDFAINFHH